MRSLMASSNFLSWQIKSMKNWWLYLQTTQNYKAEKAAGKTISDSQHYVFPWKVSLVWFHFGFCTSSLLAVCPVLGAATAAVHAVVCGCVSGCKAVALLRFPISTSRGAFYHKSYCMTGKQECFHFMVVYNVLSLLSMLFSVTVLGICSAFGQASSSRDTAQVCPPSPLPFKKNKIKFKGKVLFP